MKLRWRVEGAVDAALSALRALTVDEARAREALDAIIAPTLLLWGANDRVIPPRLISEVQVAHPTWRSRTIEGVGHVLPWEAPGSYVELAMTTGAEIADTIGHGDRMGLGH
jgi:pimeloyl-ACP methyl ester carboxylesterase